MTVERTSGHRAFGSDRLSAVVSIHSMSPCRPSARKARSRPPAGPMRSGVVIRTAAKPSSRACAIRLFLKVWLIHARAKCAIFLEVEVLVVWWRWEACHPVRQDGAERAPRLDPRVPGLRHGIIFPRDLSKVIDRGQMRRCGNVGEAHLVAGEPSPMVRQEADVLEVVAQIGTNGAQDSEVGP